MSTLFYGFLGLVGVIGLMLYNMSTPPKELSHLPRASFWKALWVTVSGKGFEERYELVRDLLTEHGICTIWSFGRWTTYLGDSEYITRLLTDIRQFPKQLLSELVGSALVTDFFGDNIVYSNGDDWKRHRKAVNTFFKKGYNVDELCDIVIHLCHRIEGDSVGVQIHHWMERLTLDMLGKAVFHIDFKEVETGTGIAASLYFQSMPIVNKAIYAIFPFLDNFRPKELAVVKQYDNLINKYIEDRKLALEKGEIEKDNDALTGLVYAASEDTPIEDRLSQKEMVWTFKMIFLAGHDTTAMALSGAFYHLSIHLEIQDKLRKEILLILSPNDPSLTKLIHPSEDQLKKMTYLNAVIKENLRLLPPVGVNIERISTESSQFGNYHIPSGTLLQAHIYHVQRDLMFWKNGDDFIPERFENEESSDNNKRWLPFSVGTRACLGTNLSLLEQKITLCMLIQKFQIQWPISTPIRPMKLGFIDLLYPKEFKLDFVPRF